jgi:hypothetical protein
MSSSQSEILGAMERRAELYPAQGYGLESAENQHDNWYRTYVKDGAESVTLSIVKFNEEATL